MSEGFVTDAAAVLLVALTVENGFCVDIAVNEAALKPRSLRALGRTGCGDAASRTSPMLSQGNDHPRLALDPSAVQKAFANLPARPANELINHSVHAAAWVSPEGDIRLVREDIGRHNALDKLLGAMTHDGLDLHAGFVAR